VGECFFWSAHTGSLGQRAVQRFLCCCSENEKGDISEMQLSFTEMDMSL